MEQLNGFAKVPTTGTQRRGFLKQFGMAGVGSTAALLFGNTPLLKGQSQPSFQDSPVDILTAGTVAEDLATVFYYNGLIGGVIQDPALAGPGGTALAVSPGGSPANVAYLRLAMAQEIAHANLWRTVGNLGTSAATDPYQMFYFPAGTFDTIAAFGATLEALENAFIGAYLNAVRELASLAARASQRGVPDGPYGGPFSAAQLEYFAMVVASVLGVEAEHRALARIIERVPGFAANNLNFEQTDGLTSVYHGSGSAVAALTPFLTPSTGPGYSLQTALSAAATIGLPSTDNPPPQ
jgi:hypothetical protein